MRLMYDAVYPQSQLNSTQYQIAAGYCGGDTPHVWTKDEWNSTTQRWRLPIWVRSNPTDANQAYVDAVNFYHQLQAIGCPHGVVVALDFETAVNRNYLAEFMSEMWSLGQFPVILYGSLSYVEQNPYPSGGYWVAEWDNLEDLPTGTRAHQYMNTPNYDLSVVSDTLVLWDTKPILPTPAPVIGDDVFSYLSLSAGVSFIPVELAGTYTKPAGGAKIGPEWLHLAAQDNGSVELYSNSGGTWTPVISQRVTPGGRVYTEVPSDGSVSMYKVVATTPCVAYLVGTQA